MFEPIDPRRVNLSKTYSLTLDHANKVKQMADDLSRREGKFISEGETLRRAIDMLFTSTYGVSDLEYAQ